MRVEHLLEQRRARARETDEEAQVAAAVGVVVAGGHAGRAGIEPAADRVHLAEERAAVDAAPADPEGLLGGVSAALDAFARGTVLDDRAMLALQRT